jgi:hypothetical protein
LIVDRSDPIGLKLLACFAPVSIVPLSKGLYWEGGELNYDPLEDWCRFWGPLKRSLWTEEREYSQCQCDGKDPDVERKRLTLEGI